MDCVNCVGGSVLDSVRAMMKRILCAFLWAVFALITIDNAHADAPSTVTEYRSLSWNPQMLWFSSGQLSCDAAKAERKWNAAVTYSASLQCQWRTTNDPTSSIWETTSVTSRTVTRCADGSAPDTTKPLAEQCQAPAPVCQAGKLIEGTYPFGKMTSDGKKTTDMQAPTVVNGCAVVLDTVIACYVGQTSGDVSCKIRLKLTGSPGTGSETPTAPAPAPGDTQQPTPSPPYKPGSGQGCPRGTVVIGTDPSGMTICAGEGSSPKSPPEPPTTTKPPVTTTNPDGSTTKTETTERLNKDGSTTTTTKTTDTAPNGTITERISETTGNRPDGLQGEKDQTKEEKEKDLCSMHPELNICKNSSVSGSCESIACTGDAIQCAALKAMAEQNCRAKTAEDAIKASAQYDLGTKVLAGNDPEASKYPSKGNAATWAMPTSLDQSGWLGGGSCFADKTFTIQGHTIAIPFSKTCDYLIVFRYVAMVIASLVAFKLLSGTILLRT